MGYGIMALTGLLLFVMATVIPNVGLAIFGYVFAAFWLLTCAIGLRKKLTDD